MGCFDLTGKKLQEDEAAAKKVCDTTRSGKLEAGACSRADALGVCTRNIGQPDEYVMVVPTPPGKERHVASFEASQFCQSGDEIGVWEDLHGAPPAPSASAAPK